MVDHVKALLLNTADTPGYHPVVDVPSDAVLSLFGFGVDAETDALVVEQVLPLALAPDLQEFRRFFDRRVTPAAAGSVYAQTPGTLSQDGLRSKVLDADGWWRVSELFHAADPDVLSVLTDMRAAAASADAPYALGAVLLACAYRRWLLQKEVQ